MNDLEQISRANKRATLDSVSAMRAAGNHVVVEYQGLNAVDAHAFYSEDAALAKRNDIAAQPGATAVYLPPHVGTEDPLTKDAQVSESLAQQAAAVGLKNFSIVEDVEPPYPAELATRPVQLVALVIVDGDEVMSIPPHRSVGVVDAENPGVILALCGPDTDLTSTRDAAVFAQAFKLRDALRQVLQYPGLRDYIGNQLMDNAQAVLDAATPQFVKFDRPSAEQELAAAREGYNPALNPDTSSILDDTRPSDVN